LHDECNRFFIVKLYLYQIIMRPKQWIDEFLQKRNLSYEKICQKPLSLYQYQLTDDEFNSLKESLKTSALLGIENIFKNVRFWDAVFVLYAAEWWRREYDGGSWKWEGVFSSFNADVNELNTPQRNLLIEKGLRYWKRDLRRINGRVRYLGSIAIEGGLPLKQLSNLDSNGGWLGYILKQAIPKYMRLQAGGVEAADIIKDYQSSFPKTFQISAIYSILGDMVDTVVLLKQVHQLNGKSNPVEYLNNEMPDWKQKFPLPIDNQVAARLLDEMITTAAKQEEIKARGFRVIRYLDNNHNLGMRIEFEKFIALEKLFEDSIQVPARLDVEIVIDKQNTHRLGFSLKTHFQDTECLKMPCLKYQANSTQAQAQYSLRFKHLSQVIAEIDLHGGETLDDNLPWVFSLQNEEWILEGVASVSTRKNSVKILFSKSLVCKTNDVVITELDNKKLLKGSGEIEFSDNEGNQYLIKTKTEPSKIYYLQGETLNFNTTPKTTYLEMPSLVCFDNETEAKTIISSHQIKIKKNSSNDNWQTLSTINQQPIGIYEIRLYDIERNILFRKRCVLLPKDFMIRLEPIAQTLNGNIYLDNLGDVRTVSCQTNVKNIISNCRGSYQIELETGDKPPISVVIQINWFGAGQELTLTVPFPIWTGQLINPDNQAIKTAQALFLEQLYGYRIRLFSHSTDKFRHLQLDFHLEDAQLNSNGDLYFRDELQYKNSLIELAVIDYYEWIKALFAISKNLDSRVCLEITEQGTILLRCYIRQYQFYLEKNEREGCVYLINEESRQLSYQAVSGTQLRAMRLSQPEQHIVLESQTSEQTELGSWLFSPEKRIAEAWLIYPTHDSSLLLRGLVWMGTNEKKQAAINSLEVSTLHQAVLVEPIYLRKKVIKKILLRMCFDFKHSGWDYLRNLLLTTQHLPLTTFDVWKVAITDSKILAALVLQIEEQAFIDKLSAELPVFWELIALPVWLAVFQEYKNYLQQQIEDEKEIQYFIEQRIKRLENLPDSMEMMARILKISLCNTDDQELMLMQTPIALTMLQHQLQEAQHELDRRQAENHWLQFLEAELKKHWQQIEAKWQLLDVSNISNHHFSSVTLPVLLAYFSLKGIPKNWLADAVHIFKLKRLKEFDEDWFNTTFHFSLAYFSQQAENQQQLLEDVNNMININDEEINQLDNEIEQQLEELKQETAQANELATTINAEVENGDVLSEAVEFLQMENEELKQELAGVKDEHQQFVEGLKLKMGQRDKALKYLLAEVKKLNQQMQTVKQVLVKRNQAGE